MIIFFLAALGLIAPAAVWMIAKTKLRLAGENEKAVTEFYSSAQKLVKDPKTPEIVVSAIEVFSKNLREGSVARHAAIRMIRNRNSGQLQLHKGTKELLDAISSMPVASRQLAFQLIISFVWSVTSRSWLYGTVVRARILSNAPQKPSSVEEAKPLIDEVTGDLPVSMSHAIAASC